MTAYEVDDHLRDHLARRLARYSRATSRIVAGDYIQLATAHGLRNQGYTHVILNPPYKKITLPSPTGPSWDATLEKSHGKPRYGWLMRLLT